MVAKLRMPFLASLAFAVFFVAVFSPVFFSGRFLTSGDGVTQALPTYFGRTPMIEPDLMLGYPLFADPNQAFWYPVLRAMRAIPNAFNAYAVLPYVVVAFGTFGFARRVSGSRPGAIVAALTVSLGGFMIAHQGHLMIVHPACWAPLVLWAIADLRERSHDAVVAGGAVALAIGCTAGTQQPIVYLAAVGCAYAVVFRPHDAARRTAFFRDVAMLLVAGFALAATALVPAAEFALRTDRAVQTVHDFSIFSTGMLEFPIRALFPYVLGGSPSGPFARPYPILGAYTEATNYAGILPILLGLVAIVDAGVRRRAMFWAGVAVWAYWMAMGETLGAASIAHAIPLYGSYRIPGRHAFEWTFSIAMLAALGVAALESGRVAWRSVAAAVAAIVAAFAVGLTVLALDGRSILASIAPDVDVSSIPQLSVFTDPTLVVPSCVAIAACAFVVLWKRFAARWFATLAIALVAADMLVFAYASYWRDDTAPASIVRVPDTMVALQTRLRAAGGRYLDLGGETTRAVPSNLATLWQLPNATGYVSLEDRSYADFFHASPTGVVSVPFVAQGEASALDLTGVRYLLLPPDPPAIVPILSALTTAPVDGFIGDAPVASLDRATYALSKARDGNVVEIVTALGNALAIPDRARVAEVIVGSSRGVLRFPLLAGVDTSESAYDRPDVHALVKHARATIFSGSNDAHLYLAKLTLPQATEVTSVSIAWAYRGPTTGALTIAHVALLDTTRAVAYPFYASGQFTQDPSHFVERSGVYDVGGERVLENLRARPHVWLAAASIAAAPDEQLRAIRTGRLDGRALDFRTTALTTSAPALGPHAPGDGVTTELAEPTREIDSVTCRNACLLVTSDLWYPGWNASIDGTSASVLPVDHALRGIVVPAGRHRVATWFASASLVAGAAISTIAATFLVAYLIAGSRRRHATTPAFD